MARVGRHYPRVAQQLQQLITECGETLEHSLESSTDPGPGTTEAKSSNTLASSELRAACSAVVRGICIKILNLLLNDSTGISHWNIMYILDNIHNFSSLHNFS